MNERENNTEHIYTVPIGVVVIQAPVNWREGLANVMSSGRMISCWPGFCKFLW